MKSTFDKKNILYFQQNTCFGATENYIITLAEYFKKKFSIAVLYPDLATLEPFKKISGVTPLPIMATRFSGNFIRNVYFIAKAIRLFNPDLVHFNDPSPLGIIASKLAGVPNIIITHHTPELHVKYGLKGVIAKYIAFRLADLFIFTSMQDQKTGIEKEKIRRTKTSVIPYGVDPIKFDLSNNQKYAARHKIQAKFNIPKDNIIIGSMARLEAQKAQVDLIEAAKIISAKRNNVTFVVAGEGSLRSELEAQITKEALERSFLLPGFISNTTEFLCALDIFVMPSLFEGLCYAILEASAVGIATVATNVGGTNYSVKNGETGILLEPGKPELLAEKLNHLIDNPGQCKKMGKKARLHFLNLFTEQQMCNSHEAIYKKFLS